ncbi:hypothetical protein F0562_009144 [Nyssa sinensis]|uniref:F-box domain-containing protein n=1 Tax=Nyssa sinensis TaxID=561372 RepID=A0A5J4ZXQ5_9ASTE|nr:hypothetical protein F0562_009144 [Nyssa sinensis]
MEEIEGIGFLPRDLIIDILARLHVKFLCKFKCVSKQWCSLIYLDPHFKNLHHIRPRETLACSHRAEGGPIPVHGRKAERHVCQWRD